MRLNLDQERDNPIGSTSFDGPVRLHEEKPSLLDAIRSALSGMDLVIGILLAAMLLPLLLGPFLVIYVFLKDRMYGPAMIVGALVLACYGFVGRDVKRGEFSPRTVFAVLGTAMVVFAIAAYFLVWLR